MGRSNIFHESIAGKSGIDPCLLLQDQGLEELEIFGPVSGGRDTAIWKVAISGRQMALRVFRPNQQSGMATEVQRMQEAVAAKLPVPKLIRSGDWRGRPFMLLEWAKGETMLESILSNPEQLLDMGQLLGRSMAEMHLATLQPRVEAEDWGVENLALAKSLTAIADEYCLVHLDFNPLNVLVDNGRISAILDWTCAAHGDPRADVARTIFLLRVSPLVRQMEPELKQMARRLAKAFLSGYREANPRLEHLWPFLEWAGQRGIDEVRHHRLHNGLEIDPRSEQRLSRWLEIIHGRSFP